ncbi:MAG: galactokinase [Bdellovibrionaceae bacterium]|nr:galactokinase [Bdellovibrionales bacterium]MCB9085846.1 galactokinase [Pseudobdellovibrionaceae bacterium]
MTINVKSPTRIDLAGGTLDCWPLFPLVAPRCTTVNFSIGICSEVELTPGESSTIEVAVEDLKYQKSFVDLATLLECQDKELSLIRVVCEYFQPHIGFKIRSRSDSPVGAGLGGSSSLTISFLKAFGQWSGCEWSAHQIVEVAHNLEAKLIHAPTGTQDYYPAFQAGLHFIHYTSDGVGLETQEVPREVFNKHLTLVYTGVPHHSGINNWQVIKAVVEGDLNVLSALREINKIAENMQKAVLSSKWGEIPQLFNEEYRFRVQLTPHFSSPRIEELKDVVLSAGADAVKICGAGGGGCVAIWSPAESKIEVERACQASGFQILPLSLEKI